MNAQATESAVTNKLHLWLLIGSGVMASAQIGKAIISVPLIRADLGFGLDLAGLVVTVFATLGAIFGIGAGVMVQRVGLRRALIGGMAVIAAGNVLGALALRVPGNPAAGRTHGTPQEIRDYFVASGAIWKDRPSNRGDNKNTQAPNDGTDKEQPPYKKIIGARRTVARPRAASQDVSFYFLRATSPRS